MLMCECGTNYCMCEIFVGVAIHGTNNLLIKDNVAFDIIGNCFYLEDGVEEYNWFEGNLAAFVHIIGRAAAGALQEGQTFGQVCSYE